MVSCAFALYVFYLEIVFVLSHARKHTAFKMLINVLKSSSEQSLLHFNMLAYSGL